MHGGLEGFLAFQLSNPDIRKANWVAMILQEEWAAVGVALEHCRPGRPVQLRVVLNHHTVENHGPPRFLCDIAFGIDPWSAKEDVVGVPLTIGAARIRKGRILVVPGTG